MKRTIAFILALTMLLSASACGAPAEDETKPADTAETPAASDAAQETETAAPEETETNKRDIPDMLPEKSFDGQVLKIAAEESKQFEITSEDLNGEAMNDAVYNRNIKIEDRFDAKIQALAVSAPHNDVNTTVTAGEYAYDIIGTLSYKSNVPILARSVLNWHELTYVNLDQPWYYNSTNKNAEINGKLFNLTSYLAITTLLDTYAMFFNERICSDFGYQTSDLYQLVYDNKWTYDNFNEILSGIYVDENGNGEADVEDVFGYIGGLCHPLDMWLAAFDQPLTSRDSEGNLTVEIMTEKTASALEKIYELTYNNKSSFRERVNYTEYRHFANARAAFTPLPFNVAFNELRDMEDTYGILPLPKWNEEQEEYRTHIHDQYTSYFLPKIIPQENYDFVGIMMEALCAESYKTVYPVYYDVALKNKYVSDPDAAEMIDIIVSGAGMDLAYVFSDSLNRVAFWFRELINNESTDIASQHKKNQKSIKNNIKKIYAVYEAEE
ncbi:MAG: hypothetical protein IJF78_17055 [Clostridia bacterium]|nr:hypothetical protein [Clostridia bacterium]